MAQVKEQSGLSNPFARNTSNQIKKPQQLVQKVDTARENVKKQLMEAFENPSDSLNDQNVKYTTDQLVTEMETMIFEQTGKNSKDKSYREKVKKILSRLKGSRNVSVRGILKKGVIAVSEFCKLTDKQMDDDSYFDKFINNGNSNASEAKPRAGTKPPNFKNVPIHAIDLTSNSDSVNEYFNNLKLAEDENTQHIKEKEQVNNTEDNQISESNLVQSNLEGNLTLVTSNNLEDNVSNRYHNTEIDTNSVRTDTFSVREELKEVQAETGKISPRANNGRAIQFNPPSRNANQPQQNKQIFNQTYDLGSNRNADFNKDSVNNSLVQNSTNDDSLQNSNLAPKKPKDKLEELKRLMEEKKGKNINMPVSRGNTSNQTKQVVVNNKEIPVNKPEPEKQIPHMEKEPEENVNSDTIANEQVHVTENVIKENIVMEATATNTVKKNPFEPEPQIKQMTSNAPFKPPQKLITQPIKKPNPTLILPNPNALEITQQKSSDNQTKSPVKNIPVESNLFSQAKIPVIEDPVPQKKENTVFESEVNLERKEEKRPAVLEKRESQNFRELTNINRGQEDSSYKILDESYNNSPKLDSRSYYSYSNRKNPNNVSKDQSIYSVKDKLRSYQESKVTLEAGLELASKKCEIYDKELTMLRKTVNELKLQLSRTNEEAYKLEITRLKQSLSSKEKENEMLFKENQNLKQQAKKFEENIEHMVEENRKFRSETERRFAQYNKELENMQNNLHYQNIKEEEKEPEEINANDMANNYYNNEAAFYKREAQKTRQMKTNSSQNSENMNKSNANEIEIEDNEEINKKNINDNNSENDYDRNNFTNGNPNIIEEVGSDNYLNMNGNTYDEMKDFKEDDNLQDHQYYENAHSAGQININYEGASEYQNFNKKPTTGDNFSNSVNIFSNSLSKGESGATNNIFNNNEDERNQEEEILFNTVPKIQSKKENVNIRPSPKEKEVTDKNVAVNKQIATTPAVNKSHQQQNRKNIFEENAFDIFDKSDNAENIFETFAHTKKGEGASNLFDDQL